MQGIEIVDAPPSQGRSTRASLKQDPIGVKPALAKKAQIAKQADAQHSKQFVIPVKQKRIRKHAGSESSLDSIRSGDGQTMIPEKTNYETGNRLIAATIVTEGAAQET